MEVSIGLPTFLLEKENHQVILVVYLLVLVVAIPVCVCLWYNESKQYMDNMIRHDTMAWYDHMLSEHTHMKVLPEILAGSSEYVLKLKMTQEQLGDIGELERDLKDYNEQMQKEKYQHRPPEKSKGYYLLHAHIFKLNIGSTLTSDLSFMLEKAPYLLEGLLNYSASRRWLQTTKNLIEFSQRLVQSVWVKESSLTQIPHFGDEEVKHATRSSKHKVRKLLDWIETPKADRSGLKDFDNQKLTDVDDAIKCIPNLKCNFEIGVEDEDTICQGDMLTLTVKMDRSNLEPGEEAGPVHAPNWPGKRQESWYVFGGMGNELRFFKKITSQSKHVTEKVQLPGPGVPNTYEMNVCLMCDSYVDVDVHKKIKFTVKSAAELPAYKPHEEDLALDEEQTLFETVMDGAASDSDADDGSNSEGSDSDWDDADSLLTPAQKEKRKEKRRRQREKGRAAAADSDEEKKEAAAADSDEEKKE
jgi:translocation protein SEC63